MFRGMTRFVVLAAALAACGPMYPPPAQQQPPPPPPPDEPMHGEPAPPPGPRAEPVTARPVAGTADAPRAPAGSVAQAFVAAHNRVRAKHCAGPLKWSPKLAQVAQKWADHLRDAGCVFGHSGGQYGENLAAGTQGVLDPEATVKMWYDEISIYKFPDGGFSMKTGHFTQVVWRGTTEVGCGHSTCNGNDIWVCNYDPPGNWEGQYRENVLPTSCR
jgi:uncharacterized protein YkwD